MKEQLVLALSELKLDKNGKIIKDIHAMTYYEAYK